MHYFIAILTAFVLTALLGYGAYLLTLHVDAAVVGGALTAASSIIIAALTLAFGRYFEKKRELEALHREKKIPIYGEFLEGLFNTFYGAKSGKKADVNFLRKWQTRITLWGGAEVVNSYIVWVNILKKGTPDAEAMNATNKLVLAIRRELGHEDGGIADDLFARLILRDYDVYAQAVKEDPKVSLAKLAEFEKAGVVQS